MNQIIRVVTEVEKITEETNERAETDSMLDLKSMIARSATDAELNRFQLAYNREDCSLFPEHYRQKSENLSMKWGFTLKNDKTIIPSKLRKKLLDMLHFGHTRTSKMTVEANNFWRPNINSGIEEKSKRA